MSIADDIINGKYKGGNIKQSKSVASVLLGDEYEEERKRRMRVQQESLPKASEKTNEMADKFSRLKRTAENMTSGFKVSRKTNEDKTFDANSKRMEEIQEEIKKSGNNTSKIRELGSEYSRLQEENNKIRNADKNKQIYNSIVNKPKAFENGYQFGDVTKTVGSTLGNIGVSLGKGAVGVGQGAGKFLASGVAQVADWVGQDDYANRVRKKIAENPNPTTGWIEENIEKPLDENSVIGETGDKILENIGQIGAYWGGGQIAGSLAGSAGMTAEKAAKISKIVSDASMFTSAAGDSFSESYSKEGVKNWQAWAKALGSGGIEMLTENLFGFFGTSGLDTGIANKVSKQISSGIGKVLVRNGIQASSESAEEVLSYLGNQGLDRIIDGIDKLSGGDGAKFSKDWSWEEVGEQVGMAFLSSLLLGTGQTVSSVSSNYNGNITEAINETARQQDIAGDIENLEGQKEKAEKRLEKKISIDEVDNVFNRIQELDQQITQKNQELLPTANNQTTLPTVNEDNTYTNKLKQQAIEEINNSKFSEQDKKSMLDIVNNLSNFTEQELSDIKQTINTYNQILQEDNKLETKGNYKNDQARRQAYMKYKNDTGDYNSTVVNEVLDTIPENRNGRRTVKQWLTAADEIGKRIANLSNKEIEQIAYKSWFDLQPSKSITQYDNVNKRNVAFQKFTSDEWVNTINKAVNETRANNQVQETLPVVNQENTVVKESIDTNIPRNLVETAKKYNLNYKDTNLSKIQKSLENKGIETRFDDTEFSNKNEGAKWKLTRNEDGTVTREIILNPKANEKTVIQEMTIHELTHDIVAKNTKTSENLYNEVKEWLSKDSQYQEQLENLKDIYGENLAEEEAIAKTLQTKFGTQEEINNLVNYNPSMARKIYDWVVDKLNKITGGKIERLYWEDVRNKFEKAYSEEGNYNNQEDTKFSKEITSDGIEYIKTELNAFIKEDGSKMTPREVYNSLVGKTIDFGDGDSAYILKWLPGKNLYNELFQRYPSYFNNIDDIKKLNNDVNYNIKELLENSKNILSNEADKNARHKKQGIISFDTRTVNFYDGNNAYQIEFSIAKLADGNKVAYAKRRFSYDDNLTKKIKANESRSSKSPMNQKPLLNNSIPSSSEDVNTTTKYSIQNSENNTQDNQGRTLSKGMQKWAKDSQARTDNGELVTVYHTTTDNVSQFNEFNPVGTPYYRFGDQVVNYYTDSKDMSGSYANNRYEMADTKRLNNLEEARQWLKEQNSILDNYTIDKVKDKKGNIFYGLNSNDRPIVGLYFENENDLLRNLKQKFNEYRDHFGYNKSKLQYEGYVNITNPYIIDAEGKNWDSVVSKLDKEIENEIKELKKNTNTVTDLINLQIESKEKHNQYLNQGIEDYSGKERYNLTEQLVEDLGKAQPQEFKSILEDTFWFGFDYDKYKNEFQKDGLELPDGNIKINEMLQNYYKKHDGNDIKRNVEKSNLYGEMTLNEFLKYAHKLFEQELLYGKEGSYFERNYSDILGKKYNSQTAISPNQLYRLAKGAFSKEAVLDILGERQTTNDIVKQVIEMNKNGSNYDGIIMKNVLDYGGNSKTREPANLYVTFASNQFKAYDNANPTSDPDIRYSNNANFDKYLENRIDKKGIRTTLGELRSTYNAAPTADNVLATSEYTKNNTMNPTEIANTSKESMNTTPKLETKNYKPGNKQSSFVSNILTDSQFLNKDLRQEMGKDENIRYYSGITNAETLEKAYNSLKEGGEKETLNWFSKDEKNISAEDVTKGWILLKQYQDAGDYQGAVEVAKKMRQMGTSAGQAVQAYNIMARLSPEGMFYYAQSELNEAYNKMVEGKSKQWIEKNQSKFELTPEETQTIIDTMKEVGEMEDGREKTVKLAEIQKLVSDKIPPSAGQSIKAWMRISMLFNPKTQVRNVMGNTVVLPVNATADVFSGAMDKLISKKTGVRTTGITKEGIKGYGKGFKKGLFESYDDFRKGINTRNVEGNRFEIGEGKSFKDKNIGKALNRVDNILTFALDAGDRGFYEASFTNSINNQLVLNNTTKVTPEMIDIATQEALQRTWQDDNAYTQTVLSIRKNLNKLNVKGYGLGDVLIPFAKTPANLTKAIVDYSPVGLTKTLALDARKFKNSLSNGQYSAQLQHKFVQNLGKGMAGSLLYVLAYGLAKAGIATGESDDDKDVKNFMKNSLGISSYSIKVGDKSFTYDWAQPVATPLAIMTNYVKYSKDNPEANVIEKAIKSLDIGSEQLLQQSFMESINTVLNGNGTTMENLSKSVLDLPARAIPTFSKQIADMVDETQRTTFEYNQPVKSAINSVVSKIPFASRTLPASVDTLGNEIQKYGGNNNIFNVMINPANTNKGQLSKAGEEIYNIYMQTGDTTIFPRTAPYYINSKGEKINMTAEERNKFQTVTGKYVESTLSSLIKDSDYKKLSNDKKAKIINEIVSDSYAKAKYDVLKIDSDEYEKKRNTLKDVKPNSYYNYKFKTDGMKKDNEKINVLINAKYTDKEKTALYENYILSKSDEKYPIIKESGININEYLKYKNQEFVADKKDDGTIQGKSISGSKKNKVFDYIESMPITYTQKVLLYGMDYTLSNNDQKLIVNYINSLPGKTKDEKLEMLSQFKGFTIYKDGSFKY